MAKGSKRTKLDEGQKILLGKGMMDKNYKTHKSPAERKAEEARAGRASRAKAAKKERARNRKAAGRIRKMHQEEE